MKITRLAGGQVLVASIHQNQKPMKDNEDEFPEQPGTCPISKEPCSSVQCDIQCALDSQIPGKKRERKVMKADKLADYILQHMDADTALRRLLKTTTDQVAKLMLGAPIEPGENGVISPLHILVCAAMDLGWNMAVEKSAPNDQVRGLVVGTKEYVEKIFAPEKELRVLKDILKRIIKENGDFTMDGADLQAINKMLWPDSKHNFDASANVKSN